jgi:hypothetical protein
MLGLLSMLILSKVVQGFRRLHQDGGLRLRRAVGCPGRVYLRIPGEGSGEGKVTIVLQGRTVELKARTNGPLLKTGAEVVVTHLLDNQTVLVAPWIDEPSSTARTA